MKGHILFLVAIILGACKTQHVYMSVQEPAPVSVPADIKKIGILNRSTPSDKTKVADAIDKVLSLEGVNLDKDGAQESIKGLESELLKNNRFTEIKNLDHINLKTTGAGVFPAMLSWSEVEKICKANEVDALFALELFDTDSKVNYSTAQTSVNTPLGSIPALEHHVSMITTVKTGWRIYDPKGQYLLDEFAISDAITFNGKGINPVVAAGALIGRKDAVKQVSNRVGQAYAMRIIPFWIRVTRDYYVKGSSNFKIAKRRARTGNWDGAAELWKKEIDHPKRKVAGRAHYNMAIINEINGDLEAAIDWAQKAYEDYNNKLALTYVRILKNRRARNAQLENQLENSK